MNSVYDPMWFIILRAQFHREITYCAFEDIPRIKRLTLEKLEAELGVLSDDKLTTSMRLMRDFCNSSQVDYECWCRGLPDGTTIYV